MKKIVSILFLVSGLSLYAQYQNNGLDSGRGFLDKVSSGESTKNNFRNRTKELVGSEYLNKEFVLAKITTVEGKSAKVGVRLNTYSQEFEIKKGTEILALNYSIVQKVEVEDKIFKPVLDENSKYVFAQELVDGNLSLFKKYKAVLKEGKIVPGIQTETAKDRIVIKESFLIKKHNSEVFSILKLKKKAVLEIISSNKEIINFVKKNKLSYKKEDDVIIIFNFFNSVN